MYTSINSNSLGIFRLKMLLLLTSCFSSAVRQFWYVAGRQILQRIAVKRNNGSRSLNALSAISLMDSVMVQQLNNIEDIFRIAECRTVHWHTPEITGNGDIFHVTRNMQKTVCCCSTAHARAIQRSPITSVPRTSDWTGETAVRLRPTVHDVGSHPYNMKRVKARCLATKRNYAVGRAWQSAEIRACGPPVKPTVSLQDNLNVVKCCGCCPTGVQPMGWSFVMEESFANTSEPDAVTCPSTVSSQHRPSNCLRYKAIGNLDTLLQDLPSITSVSFP